MRRTAKLVPKTPALARALTAMEEDEAIETVAELPLSPNQRIADVPPRPTARPLTTQGVADAYDAGAAVNIAPVPPAQHSDDPGFTDADAPTD